MIAELFGWVIGGQKGRKGGTKHEGCKNPKPDDSAAVLAEVIPELAQGAGAVFRFGRG